MLVALIPMQIFYDYPVTSLLIGCSVPLMTGLTLRVRKRKNMLWYLVISWVILVGILAQGTYHVHHAANVAKTGLQDNLVGLAKSFAVTLQYAGHEKITLDAPEDDLYWKMIAMMSEWQEQIPLAASIYTFRRNAKGNIAFVCCPPADLNRDGKIEGKEEQLTRKGKVYAGSGEKEDEDIEDDEDIENEEDIPEILAAFEGKSSFNNVPTPDQWGLWISAAEPIFVFDDNGEKSVDAVLGVDFWGEDWNSDIRSAVFWPRLFFLSAVILFFAVQIFIIRQQGIEYRLTEYAASLEQVMEELVVAKKDADLAAEAKSFFLANVSHEIRTPLNAILGCADIFIKDVMDHSMEVDRKQLVDMMRKSSKNLMTLIDDVLQFSDIDMNRIALESVPVVLRQLVEDVKTMVSTDLAQKPDIEFRIEWGHSVPEIILGDPVRLRQILLCLVSNAVKFTKSGHVIVRCFSVQSPNNTVQTAATYSEYSHLTPLDPKIALAKGLRGTVQIDRFDEQKMLSPQPIPIKLQELLSDSPVLQIDVSDTGIGIDRKQFDFLFKPFSQVDNTSTREFGGTGLGLSIVKGLVELMGGKVQVKSKLGHGSTFTVFIPVRECEDSLTVTFPPLQQQHRGTEAESLPLQGYNILVVDDVVENRFAVETKLRDMGANVRGASNGQIAVDMALKANDSNLPFDFIFMDLQMPTMDGFEATSTLRQRGFTKPIVALTASRDSHDLAIASGCNLVLSKPADGAVLLKTIMDLVQRK